MIRVKNQKVIARLSNRSFQANRRRNMVAICAIVLTTLMFTALFTIAGTVLHSFEQQTFRQVGGDMHGTFKYLTKEQMETLEKDPRIVASGERLVLGMATGDQFRKAHVEVSAMNEVNAKGSFCVPVKGDYPKEGTKELACDTRVLKLLGVKPELGAEITLPFTIGTSSGSEETSDTFTLSGWWEYDPANMASMVILPLSYVEEKLVGFVPTDTGDIAGTWDLNVYLKNSRHIARDLDEILKDAGFQGDSQAEENYIATGVNWAYLGAQASANMDPTTAIALVVLLLLITATGYLIIYNIFQISVTGDIHFYGLLKTIGTTGRQIKRILRRQAYKLSVFGIPVGLILGYLIGSLLVPEVIAHLNVNTVSYSTSPLIFLGAAAFSLVTVLISCNKPAKFAAKVSPIEAVRYTESNLGEKKKTGNGPVKGRKKGAKITRMALANLGRNRKKTFFVILSLSLAVVLLQCTYSFAVGFDMDKYLASRSISDFILGGAEYFQTSGFFSEDSAVGEGDIEAIQAQRDITKGGRIYGNTSSIETFKTEEAYKNLWTGLYETDAETIESMIKLSEKNEKGEIADNIQIYGMEDFPLSKLEVMEGNLADLKDPEKHAIAAVYLSDDYGDPIMESQHCKVGDKVTIRYVEEWERINADTGEVIEDGEHFEGNFIDKAKKYRDVEYTVAAAVMIPSNMSYRYFSAEEYVLGSEQFQQDTGTSDIMTYLFDTTKESNEAMQSFVKNYTEQVNPLLDFESKLAYVVEFQGMRDMFLLLGAALSLIIGIVGILNFFNAMLTSIMTRKKEFAILQSIGMTGKQLKQMLILEGLNYAGFTMLCSVALSAIAALFLQKGVGNILWFFTYHFTVLPLLMCVPVLVIIAVIMPIGCFRGISKESIVERIRDTE